MAIPLRGEIICHKDNELCIRFEDNKSLSKLLKSSVADVSVFFFDVRPISREQQMKIYAMCADIADYCSWGDRDYIKNCLIDDFCYKNAIESFSISTVDMTVASRFIKYLIEFFIKFGIPSYTPLVEQCEDIQHFVYIHLLKKRCALCGIDSSFHHCTGSRTGMGRKSVEIPLVGLNGLPLCEKHHDEIHMDAEQVFLDKYHLEPAVVDDKIASQYKHYKQDRSEK